jgi:hypothetical protein
VTAPLPVRTFGRLLAALALVGPASLAAAPPKVDFNRQVLPILSDKCFACHGPDAKARKAKLRFDTKEGAFGELRSGDLAIVPGKPEESAMVERVSSKRANFVMPPPAFNKKLKPEEVEILRRWVAEGAGWQQHWAYVVPKRPAVPRGREAQPSGWPHNAIDNFVLDKLQTAGLKPAPQADKITLIRRVTLDLTGLPPTPEEVDAFLADPSPSAYEKVVDRLLQSPRYGEHRARYWLDAARYGDTHGLHLDNYREIWPFRDYVIKSFNTNKPFDQFVVEQLAGDLLPGATLEQIVATGFNRCHVSTSEGGSIAEEVYVRNVVDEVDTTGTVFLGLTVGCSRCHDHKYDPIKQKDYYSLFAFFNSIAGPALDGNAALPPPSVKVAGPEDLKKLERYKARVAAIKKEIAAAVAKVKYDPADDAKAASAAKRADYVWIADGLPAGAKPEVGGVNAAWQFVSKAKHPVYHGEKSARLQTKELGQLVMVNASPGLTVGRDDTLFAYVYLDPKDPPKEIMLQWHSSGWLHRAYWGANTIPWGRDGSTERHRVGELPKAGQWVRLEVPAAKVGIKPGTVVTGWAFTQFGGTAHWDNAGVTTRTPQGNTAFDTFAGWLQAQRSTGGAALPKPLKPLARNAKRTKAQTKQLRDYFIENAYTKSRDTFAPLHKKLKAVEAEMAQLDKNLPATLVFKEADQPKPAYILKRGEYDQKGEKVGRATPGFLPPMPKDAPKNRLGFARWLVAPENPLTARVAVNRFWQSVFGTGLVRTADDFGSQGEPPSHPELLDWLAVEFRESGWDVKKLTKLMVMSATYRQSAGLTPEKLAKDGDNRLLSRGPRFRLDAESLRDQALFVGGLLVEHIGGPSVKPPQPAGLWEAVAYTGSNTAKFKQDTGAEKVHRRSLYTFWKRTAPPPQMSIADAPSRESCTVRRERTNTPLQALLLMNEKQYVEAARALAARTMREADAPDARLAAMFRRVTCRVPDAREMRELQSALRDFRAAYDRDPAGAKKLIAVGATKPDPKLDAGELAAYTMVGNLVLNLDEVLNK